MTVYEASTSRVEGIETRFVFEDPALDLSWTLLAGHSGFSRQIRHPRIQKSGLALVGHLHGLVKDRVQIMGETELSYVESLTPAARAHACAALFDSLPCCVVVTRGVRPPAEFISEAERTKTPLICIEEKSSTAIAAIHTVLDEHLAPRCRLHGVLIDIFEVGVLLVGQSGIGKSECALELVMKGHRLVADDVVECDFRPPGMIFGEPADPLRHYMEVRGLGILNIKDLYGVTAVRDRKRIDLIVELELWHQDSEYDRIGVEDHHRKIMNVPIREVRLPIQPGRNMISIIEIAARAELLRRAGHHPAKEFVDRIEQATMTSQKPVRNRVERINTPNESAAPPRVQVKRPSIIPAPATSRTPVGDPNK